MTGETIARIRALFDGLGRAYGRYREAKPGEKKGSGVTVTGPVTDELWASHLAGKQRLGIVPIRDDNTVLFGAVDIDDYAIGVDTLAARAAGLPVVVTRSKSGGAHCWLFLIAPAPAQMIREWLTGVAVFLGYPGAEVFPKQNVLASKEDVGNWIHMPYFDAERTLCGGILPGGQGQALDEWLSYAEAHRVPAESLEPVKVDEHAMLEGAPPCLQAFARNGVPDGQRNVALFAFGVYCQKAVDPGWEDELARMNQAFMVPPLDYGEVGATIKSLTRKKYFYPCNKPPLTGVCNKAICRTVEHGIGGTPTDPGIQIESITKVDSDPPFYFVQVNGHRIEIADSGALLNQVRFRQLVFERLDVIPRLIKEAAWASLINSLMANAQHIEAPADASAYGQFEHHLAAFLTGGAMARSREEVLLGRRWRDDDDVVWFRYSDLETYLDRRRFRAFNSQKIWATMKQNLKAQHKFWNMKGGAANVWGVSLSTLTEKPPTEPFDVPPFDTAEDPMPGQQEPSVDWGDYDIGGMH